MKKMRSFSDSLANSLFGRTLTEAHEKRVCVICGKPATKFKDQLSVDEYRIIGTCQKCQDALDFEEAQDD